jgi:hypothetical protein
MGLDVGGGGISASGVCTTVGRLDRVMGWMGVSCSYSECGILEATGASGGRMRADGCCGCRGCNGMNCLYSACGILEPSGESDGITRADLSVATEIGRWGECGSVGTGYTRMGVSGACVWVSRGCGNGVNCPYSVCGILDLTGVSDGRARADCCGCKGCSGVSCLYSACGILEPTGASDGMV